MSDRNITRRDACLLFAVGGAGLFWSSSCALAQTKPQREKPNETFEQIIQRTREANKLPGLAAAVVRADKMLASHVAGVRSRTSADPLTVDDRFHIASCTKSITATLAAIAVHRGQLKWSTTIADALPELVTSGMKPVYRSATLEQLLAHEARMPAYTQPSPAQVGWMKSFEGSATQQRRTFLTEVLRTEEPNTARGSASYSNIGYAAAGAMVEKATGISWEQLVLREIAQPLGMKSVGFGYPATTESPSQPRGHSQINANSVELPLDDSRQLAVCLWPAGAVHCSIGDLALYAADHLNGLRGRKALLPQPMYRHLHRPLTGGGSGFTLGWGIAQHERWGMTHFGAGSGGWFFARIMIAPEHDAAVVVASNSGLAGDATRQLSRELLERFAPDKAGEYVAAG